MRQCKPTFITFGASAPLKELQKKFGFTVEAVCEAARDQVTRTRSKRTT